MFKAVINDQSLKKNDQTLTVSSKLEEEELSSAHRYNCIPLSIHASLSWMCKYTGNKNESKCCAICLISHCHRLPSAVGEGSDLAHLRTVILDIWSRCQARVVEGNLNNQCEAGWPIVWHGKNFSLVIFSWHSKCDKICQMLSDFTPCWVLPIHTTFSDLEYISRSQQWPTVLTKNFMFLSNLSWKFVWCSLIMLTRLWIGHYFFFFFVCVCVSLCVCVCTRTGSKEIIEMFPDLTKSSILTFLQTIELRSFKFCMIWWLLICLGSTYTKFGDLDLFQGHICVRSIKYVNYKFLIFFLDSCPV